MQQKRLTDYMGVWISVLGRSPLRQAFQLDLATVPQRKIACAELKLQLTSLSCKKIPPERMRTHQNYSTIGLFPILFHICLCQNLSHKLSQSVDLFSNISVPNECVFILECNKFRKVIGPCNRNNFLNQKKLLNPRDHIRRRHFHKSCRHTPSDKDA
uniref:Uncharacterized protein n=1 Tax=Micrurus lemniscatus lemniscatus TaxID=129467 RepID=A0A2D4HM16_MICLE